MEVDKISIACFSLILLLSGGCVSTEELNKVKQDKIELEKQKTALAFELNTTKSLYQKSKVELDNKTKIIETLSENITNLTTLVSEYELAYQIRQINNEKLSEEISSSKRIDASNDIILYTNLSASEAECQRWLDANIAMKEAQIERASIYSYRTKKLLEIYKTDACRSPLQKQIDLNDKLNQLRREYIQILDKEHFCTNYFDPYYSYSEYYSTYVNPLDKKINQMNSVISELNQYVYDSEQFCGLE